MRTIVILAATIPCIISLMICGEAEMQSFDTPLGKIELDAPWDLKIITDESQDGEFGCKSGENEHCRYGFQDIENAEAANNGDAYRDYRFDIDFYPQEDDKLTFEEIIKQEWTLDENDPPGEWTTTNEGRKMYFERNSAFDDSIAIIDYLNDTNQIVVFGSDPIKGTPNDAWQKTDPGVLLSISRSFKLINIPAQSGFGVLLSLFGLLAIIYMRRMK